MEIFIDPGWPLLCNGEILLRPSEPIDNIFQYSIRRVNETDGSMRHPNVSHSFLFPCLHNFCALFIDVIGTFYMKHNLYIMILPCERHVTKRSEKSDATYPIRAGGSHAASHFAAKWREQFRDCLVDPKFVATFSTITQPRSPLLLRHKCTIHVQLH